MLNEDLAAAMIVVVSAGAAVALRSVSTRSLMTAVMLLLAGSAAAAAGNLLRAGPLPWVREELPAPPKPPAESGLSVDGIIEYLTSGTAHFVDAREPHEYAAGHLRGAINLPSMAIYQNIERVTSMIPPTEKVIVYCGGGDCEASHHVRDALQRDFGFADVQIFEKGWAEIEKSGRFKAFVMTGDQP